METTKGTGIIKFFNKTKAYGFIKSEDANEYFVHITNILEGEISMGDNVSFDIEENPRGKKAINVKKI